MPLVNILGIVAEVPPVFIAIDDCTGKYSLFPKHVAEDDEEPFMIYEDLCEIIADTEQVEELK